MNRIPQELVERIRDLRRTMSIAEVAAETRLTKQTVIAYSRGVIRDACGCGKLGGHKGWCAVMLAKSPRRQAMIATLKPPNFKWTDGARDLVRKLWESGVGLPEIAMYANALMGREDISEHAVQVIAGKIGARRPRGYLSAMRRDHRLRYWSNKMKWQNALPDPVVAAPLASVPAARGFSMLAMRGPDPLNGLRLRQRVEASKGRL